MQKSKLDKLAAALESAGFEIVSLKEETNRHLCLERGITPFSSREDVFKLDNNGTGVFQLELKAL